MDFKQLNEELEKFLMDEAVGNNILGYPMIDPPDYSYGSGDVLKMVPTGYYLGVTDGQRIAGAMSVRVIPNELYYAFGTKLEGVYKFDTERKAWKCCLERPIDFRGIDYEASVDVFLKNTKSIRPQDARRLIVDMAKLNNRPTFGDENLKKGDKVKTKDGLHGTIFKVYQDFGGQLYYKIELDDGSLVNVYCGNVGLDK